MVVLEVLQHPASKDIKRQAESGHNRICKFGLKGGSNATVKQLLHMCPADSHLPLPSNTHTSTTNYTMESFKAFSQQLNPLAAKLSKQYSQAKQVRVCA